MDYEVESILKKDSLDLTDADREFIQTRVASTRYDKVIVTHGTDTMIKTARELESVSGKTIVMTGSMYPRTI